MDKSFHAVIYLSVESSLDKILRPNCRCWFRRDKGWSCEVVTTTVVPPSTSCIAGHVEGMDVN
jgi:hypothetical protein